MCELAMLFYLVYLLTIEILKISLEKNASLFLLLFMYFTKNRTNLMSFQLIIL